MTSREDQQGREHQIYRDLGVHPTVADLRAEAAWNAEQSAGSSFARHEEDADNARRTLYGARTYHKTEDGGTSKPAMPIITLTWDGKDLQVYGPFTDDTDGWTQALLFAGSVSEGTAARVISLAQARDAEPSTDVLSLSVLNGDMPSSQPATLSLNPSHEDDIPF